MSQPLVRLTPADTGRRVVVRRRLGVEAGRAVYGDVLGLLESWAGGTLVIIRRDGERVTVPEDTVVAGKPVPPPPARGRPEPGPPDSGAWLARVAARGWPALETADLGGWLLQAADGFTGRANSVVPAGEPGMPLPAALDRVTEFYADRGLLPRIQAVVGTPLEHDLAALGWRVHASGKAALTTVDVQVVRLSHPRVSEAVGALPHQEFGIDIDDRLDDDWLRRYGRGPGSPVARHVLGGPRPLGLARAKVRPGIAGVRAGDSEESAAGPAGIGRGVVTDQWLGISAVEVAPEIRRRGLGRALVAALLRWGVTQGATWAYLQVGSDETAALAMYDQLGFRTDHQYRYYGPGS